MFTVMTKDTKEITTVYSVRQDRNGFASFLVYTNHSWCWLSAKLFCPIEEKNKKIN